jgi:sulfatase maturation enzyme AslB (radical SAM superfamily)
MDLTPYRECPAHKQWIFIANGNASQAYTEEFYRPCCWFKNSVSAKDPAEFYSKLSTMDIETNCEVCINMEKSGSWSPRTAFIESISSDKTLVITASFDTLCNLKCITCSPENSTQIASELIRTNPNKDDIRWFTRLKTQAPGKVEFIKQLLSEYEFDELRFELLGGEPFINPMVLEFIDWLALQPYAKKTSLSITTNGTKCHKIHTYIRSFKHVGVQLSVDGIEDTFEYIRSGADYAELNDSINYYYIFYEIGMNNKTYNFSMSFNYTLSWMNAMHFGKFITWLSNTYPKVSSLLVTKLLGPDRYSIDILSTKQRKQIYEKSMSMIDVESLSPGLVDAVNIYKQHMFSTGDTSFNLVKFNDALNTMTSLDQLRNTSYQNVFAETIDFIHDNI